MGESPSRPPRVYRKQLAQAEQTLVQFKQLQEEFEGSRLLWRFCTFPSDRRASAGGLSSLFSCYDQQRARQGDFGHVSLRYERTGAAESAKFESGERVVIVVATAIERVDASDSQAINLSLSSAPFGLIPSAELSRRAAIRDITGVRVISAIKRSAES